MANLAKNLEAAVAAVNETITHCVLGEHYNFRFGDGDNADKAPINVILSWADARPWLDEEYDNGYGDTDCRPFYAYSETLVWLVREYDGATSIDSVPRNPDTTRARRIFTDAHRPHPAGRYSFCSGPRRSPARVAAIRLPGRDRRAAASGGSQHDRPVPARHVRGAGGLRAPGAR